MTSIIILTYNHLEDYTIPCIESIRRTCDDYEIIVVDNASTDGTVEWLRQQKDIKLIANSENAGFAKGCNQGAKLAIGDDILFLNNDTIMCENSLKNLVHGLWANKKVKVAAVSAYQNADFGWRDKERIKKISKEEWVAFGNIYNNCPNTGIVITKFIMAFAMLIKKYVWDEMGGFDERFGLGNYEDDDFCKRLLLAGHKFGIVSHAFIYHKWHGSWEKEQLSELLKTNKKIFNDKWGIDP